MNLGPNEWNVIVSASRRARRYFYASVAATAVAVGFSIWALVRVWRGCP